MDRAIQKLNAGQLDIHGIGRLANVVVDAVTGMPADEWRLWETARSLFRRLTRRLTAGQLAGYPCGLRPLAACATWRPEPTSSGTAHSRFPKRLGRPRSAIRVGGF